MASDSLNSYSIAIPHQELVDDAIYRLLEKTIFCSTCGGHCTCEGCNGHDLIYRCRLCGELSLDRLEFEPLFAADVIQQATLRHYEIACPYCGEKAPLVGGSASDGLFFVCEKRCHNHFTPYIRRY